MTENSAVSLLIEEELKRFKAPDGKSSLQEAGILEKIEVKGQEITLILKASREHKAYFDALARTIEGALKQKGLEQVTIILRSSPDEKLRVQRLDDSHPTTPHAGKVKGRYLPEVKTVIAVASGKGGVGKSSVALNLALTLAKDGTKVGLLDADIFGPSLPLMAGKNERPQVKDGILSPVPAFGLQTMSIGYLVPPETAMAWRGPMVMNALEQMLASVDWSGIETLVIDLPPGTGDVQLTLVQKLTLSGAVIVSTPQAVALADVRRGVKLFEQTYVPILGVIENMSDFTCPHCGHHSDIFSHGGAREEAERSLVPFLGEIPLLPAIREASDTGQPIVLAEPDGEAARAFAAIAEKLKENLQENLKKQALKAPQMTMI